MSELKLLDRMRNEIHWRQFSIATERICVCRARRFILFHNKRHPITMGKEEVENFRTHPAVQREVSPSTQAAARKAVPATDIHAQIPKRVTCQTLMRLCATHLLESGTDIRTIQQLLGHNDLYARGKPRRDGCPLAF